MSTGNWKLKTKLKKLRSSNHLSFFEFYPLLIQYYKNKIPKPVKMVYLLSLFYLQLQYTRSMVNFWCSLEYFSVFPCGMLLYVY